MWDMNYRLFDILNIVLHESIIIFLSFHHSIRYSMNIDICLTCIHICMYTVVYRVFTELRH